MATKPIAKSPAPFNPLDKKNLGVSVADALLSQPRSKLREIEPFIGAGIYAIYYTGNFDLYKPISIDVQTSEGIPIYVGKAVPVGARKGGFGLGLNPGQVLYKRLGDHAGGISEAENLEINDFEARYLVVEDIWIPLGESLLIERYQPVWNAVVDGFGNHDPGSGRHNQARSSWDTLHPGRPWVASLRRNPKSVDQIRAAVDDHFKSTMPL